MRFIFDLVAVVLVECGTVVEADCAEGHSAEVADAIERGWLPLGLPAEASGISEKHDLDTNGVPAGEHAFDAHSGRWGAFSHNRAGGGGAGWVVARPEVPCFTT
jgi:hypothetical protein